MHIAHTPNPAYRNGSVCSVNKILYILIHAYLPKKKKNQQKREQDPPAVKMIGANRNT